MRTIRTINFLPEVFRSTTNQKFLNATIDQLVAEPETKKLNGYIGRKFAPTYKAGDNYLPEETDQRQDYQLEPCVVVNDKDNNIQFLSSYSDLLGQIQHHGGIVSNHSRLFNNEVYSFNSKLNFDKLVNFSQYYWMPAGPESVGISSGEIALSDTFTVTRNVQDFAYNISGYGEAKNPDIILARGGTYEFSVSQPGAKFWIQVSPGVDGSIPGQNNVDGRDVYGVTNNGVDQGVVTFNVPTVGEQDYFIDMPLVREVDLATSLKYTDINSQLIINVRNRFNGIDGISDELNGKYLIFTSPSLSDSDWVDEGPFALGGWGETSFDEGDNIPVAQRTGVWQIQIQNTGNGAELINLVWVEDIPINHKVIVKSGSEFSNRVFYKDAYGEIAEAPLITAPMTELYYNDGNDQRFSGKIRIVDSTGFQINVSDEILGKTKYVSPNGVEFTNGLRVQFDSDVVQPEYANNEYYVEGVGVSIRLIKVDDLVTPELDDISSSIPFDVYGFSEELFDESINGPTQPDYITINRSSVDLNAWSRSNRWFHIDVISKTAEYNNKVATYDYSQRAQRPIIEFESDIQLFNYGRIARTNIDLLDLTITDAMNQVEGSVVEYIDSNNDNIDDSLTFAESVPFRDGMTVIFANDLDLTVKNKVFKVELMELDSETKVHLSPIDGQSIQIYDSVIPKFGVTVNLVPTDSNVYSPLSRQIVSTDGIESEIKTVISPEVGLVKSTGFWYDGEKWIQSQQKVTLNTAPLFDIVDENGVSFADRNIYTASTFTGTKIFSFKEGSGEDDTVLGFPLSYRNFSSVGDIEFENNFDVDRFTTVTNLKTESQAINTGFIPSIASRESITKGNIWSTKNGPSKQFQIISAIATGTTNKFTIDILPKEVVNEPTIKVFVNNKMLPENSYAIVITGIKYEVELLSTPDEGDKVDMLIDSDQVSKMGYFEIPLNLDYNALNQNFLTLTLGQLRNHLSVISENTNSIVGETPGFSNLRDLNIKNINGSILQHSAPATYSSLFLIDKEANFVDSLSFAAQEYLKFKNRFLELYSTVINSGITNPRLGVDLILQKLNEVKNSKNSWHYSDMVPYDQNRSVISYTVINEEVQEYEIESVFNDTQISNKAVLVYVDGQQLIKDKDYRFNQDRPSVVFTNPLSFDQKIEIYTFYNTDGCYIPETPTKLGLYPKFVPEEYVDTTYQNPLTVIRGHDGSITPKFNDLRDELLLELELRIYNNIKVSYNSSMFDIYKLLPGNFRSTEYSKAEFDYIISQSFLIWAGSNKVDFSTNSWFASNNPWSWTYSKFRNVTNGEYLPGYWRGIYKYFYDTDAPNARPWEMLGFSDMPDWWVSTYGPSPYTGGNLVLWQDLENGTIRYGDRAGSYAQYARPGLLSVIPVTESGELRSPDEFLVTAINSANASSGFVVGDEGPAETAWRRSSDYPFALQRALALMKPAQYFGLLASLQDYKINSDTSQKLISGVWRHITPADLKVNGELANGSVVRNAGYLNWIADYITNHGMDPVATIRGKLDFLGMQLGYKVAGYTDKKQLKILAEQSSPSSTNASIIIPDENYKVHMHKSSPVDNVVYSAVIIEKTGTGYTIRGYNLKLPFFTIIPSEPNSNNYQITASGVTGTIYKSYKKSKVLIPYGYEFKNKQQVVDFLVGYERFLESQGFSFIEFDQQLGDTRNWKLSIKEFLTWTQQGWGAGNVIVVSPVLNAVTLTTENAVVDEISNTVTGAKVLDIGFNVVKPSLFTVIREDETFVLSSVPEVTLGLVELNLVQHEHVLVFDNRTLFNDVIYSPELGNRQFRLKLIGNKTGNWKGQVSPAGFILGGFKLDEWSAGKDYRKGDIVKFKDVPYSALENLTAADTFNFRQWKQINANSLKSGLLPNMSINAQKFEQMYDIDNPLGDSEVSDFGLGLLGYRERKYLSELSLSATTQAKFYQGYIRDKGTKDAVTALTSAEFNSLKGDVEFNEEWAFRVGEYGALEANQVVEIQLTDAEADRFPISVSLLNDGEEAQHSDIVGVHKGTLYKRPIKYKKNIFKNRDDTSIYENDILTAGYVNLNDIDATIFDIENYKSADGIVASIYRGFKIWVAKDSTRDWNVYRCDETSVRVIKAEYELDKCITLTMSEPHNLEVGDLFAVVGFTDEIDSFYQVERVDSQNTVFVTISAEVEASLIDYPVLEDDGALFKLRSLRVDRLADIADYVPNLGWTTADKIWVDSDTADGRWATYQKTLPWTFVNEVRVPKIEVISNSQLGFSSSIRKDGLVGVVGSPAAGPLVDQSMTLGNGVVRIATKGQNNAYSFVSSITLAQDGVSKFGHAVDISNNVIVVGAPESEATESSAANAGKVIVYNINNDSPVLRQMIGNVEANSYFGYSVSLSQDSKWMYVGAPGANKVYVYRLKDASASSHYVISDNSTYLFSLPFSPVATEAVTLFSADKTLVPEEEFVVHNSAGNLSWHGAGALSLNEHGNYNYIEFKNTPTAGIYFTVKQNAYYDLVTTITRGDSVAGDRFGHAVRTNADGTTFVVGAPDRTTDSTIKAGATYVYNRYVQEFIGNGATTAFTLGKSYNAAFLPQVFKNGVEVVSPAITIGGTTLTFTVAPAVNDKIRVELNSFADTVQELDVGELQFEARFGTSVVISESGKTVFASAPGQVSPAGNSGAVYRFFDDAHEYNSVLSTQPLTSYSNKKIKVNNRLVSIPIGNAASIVNYLNTTAGIVGLTAANENNYLRLSFFTTSNEKFTVMSNDLAELEVTSYKLTQTILSPRFGKFGTQLSYVETTSTLAVASEGADTQESAIFDGSAISLDGSITTISDKIPNTGTVFVFEELGINNKTASTPTKFSLVDDLMPEGVNAKDNFGSSIAMTDKVIFVGATLGESRGTADDSIAETTDAGQVFYFENPAATKGWNKIKSQEEKVDVDSATRIFLYDRKSQTILTMLDAIDPVKGHILGVAEQDIEYKTEYDPAIYNRGTNAAVSINENFHFGRSQVGKVWWNLSKVRYIDYEQNDLSYRIKNWGSVFPGSEIEVVEWVESSNPPSAYTGDGTPLYDNDHSAYVQETVVDSSGIIKSSYYFWVKDKTSVDENLSFRRMHTSMIADLIRSPSTQNIPYVELLQDNSIAIVNANQFISANDTILHIEYSVVQNDNIVHNEYELVRENSASAIIPQRIIDKLVDSLSGEDKFSSIVPDHTLSAAEKYGISIRPRQTMFVNRTLAIKNFVQFVNNVFKNYPITDEFNLSKLFLADPLPTNWDPVANKNVSVNSIEELLYLDTSQIVVGQRILVISNAEMGGQWAVHEYMSDFSFYVVQTQNYDTADYWEVSNWFDASYDPSVKPTYTVEVNSDIAKINVAPNDIVHVNNSGSGKFIVYRVSDDLSLVTVGVEDGTIQLLNSLWAHEDSQIGLDNDAFDTVKFDLNPTIEIRNIFNAIKDDIFVDELDSQFNNLFFTMLNYLMSEQRAVDWAFKTSLVSVIHRLRKLDQDPKYIRDNQTFFEEYINEVKPYRTKIREYIAAYDGLDEGNLAVTDFDLPSYYDTDLAVWRSPSGEYARDDLLLDITPEYTDWVNNHTYYISDVLVADGGYGYSAPPELVVTGGGGSGAVLEADIDLYLGKILKIRVINPGSGFTSTPTIEIHGDGLIEGTNIQSLICYPVLKNDAIRSFDSRLKFDRISYTSDVKQWKQSTAFEEGDVVSYQNKAYRVLVDFTSGLYFNLADFDPISDGDLANAADRVMACYAPDQGMPAKSLPRLFYGVDYEEVKVDGAQFTDTTDELIDSNIQSQFDDLELGTRPEDINIVGGGFVDVYNSHAPEELLPGLMFDTLDMRVFTINLNAPAESPLGFRISKVMSTELRTTFDNYTTTFDNNSTSVYENLTKGMWEFRRICAAATTELAQNLEIGDTTIYVVDVTKLAVPRPENPTPGVVYINGEKITYYVVDTEQNSLGQIRRGTWGTGAPTVHLAGSRVVDASLNQKIPSTVSTSGNNIGRQTDESTDWQFENKLLADGDSPQALFIRDCPSYLPWPPGNSGYYTDPNVNRTRFDDNGAAEPNQGHPAEFEIHWVTTVLEPGDPGYSDEEGADNTVKIGYNIAGNPVHTFDQDPFDSYEVA